MSANAKPMPGIWLTNIERHLPGVWIITRGWQGFLQADIYTCTQSQRCVETDRGETSAAAFELPQLLLSLQRVAKLRFATASHTWMCACTQPGKDFPAINRFKNGPNVDFAGCVSCFLLVSRFSDDISPFFVLESTGRARSVPANLHPCNYWPLLQ